MKKENLLKKFEKDAWVNAREESLKNILKEAFVDVSRIGYDAVYSDVDVLRS